MPHRPLVDYIDTHTGQRRGVRRCVSLPIARSMFQQVPESFPGHYSCSGTNRIPGQRAQCGSRWAISALRTRTSPLRENKKGAGPLRFPASSVGLEGEERAALIRSWRVWPSRLALPALSQTSKSPGLQRWANLASLSWSPNEWLPAWRKFYGGRFPGQAQQAMVGPGFCTWEPQFRLVTAPMILPARMLLQGDAACGSR